LTLPRSHSVLHLPEIRGLFPHINKTAQSLVKLLSHIRPSIPPFMHQSSNQRTTTTYSSSSSLSILQPNLFPLATKSSIDIYAPQSLLSPTKARLPCRTLQLSKMTGIPGTSFSTTSNLSSFNNAFHFRAASYQDIMV
jgi:hypothetical protein